MCALAFSDFFTMNEPKAGVYRINRFLIRGQEVSQKSIEILDNQLEEQSKKPYSKMSLKMYCVKQHIEEHIKNFDFWIRPFNFTHYQIKLSV